MKICLALPTCTAGRRLQLRGGEQVLVIPEQTHFDSTDQSELEDARVILTVVMLYELRTQTSIRSTSTEEKPVAEITSGPKRSS